MEYKRGFTLIELLVVIAIVGVLASISVSSLGNSRQKAEDISSIAILKQVGGLLDQWAVSDVHGGYPDITGADDDASWIATLAVLDPEQVAQLPGSGSGYSGESTVAGYCLWKVSQLDPSKTIYCETGAKCSDKEGVDTLTALPAGCTHPTPTP